MVLLIALSECAVIECIYDYPSYDIMDQVYRCLVENNPDIKSPENAQISSVSGTHKSGHSNDNVDTFHSEGKIIQYFPQGIDKIFKHIKAIAIESANLKELHQSDLKPFTKLEFLSLWGNDIEVLEEGLFAFNPQIKLIELDSNKISHIHPDVFDHLTVLTDLRLTTNKCINKSAYNAADVKALIPEIKTACPSPVTTTMTTTFKPDVWMEELKMSIANITEEVLVIRKNMQEDKLEMQQKIKDEIKALKKEMKEQKEELMNEMQSIKDGMVTESADINKMESSFESFMVEVNTHLFNLMNNLKELTVAVNEIKMKLNWILDSHNVINFCTFKNQFRFFV